jgi:hypothetical protein
VLRVGAEGAGVVNIAGVRDGRSLHEHLVSVLVQLFVRGMSRGNRRCVRKWRPKAGSSGCRRDDS